jgi:hypothetical protein
MLAELLLLASLHQHTSVNAHPEECYASFMERLRTIAHDTISGSLMPEAQNDNRLMFLFRDSNQSSRLFVLATALLSFKVSLPLSIGAFSGSTNVLIEQKPERCHPAIYKTLMCLSGFAFSDEHPPGQQVFLTTGL